MFRYQLKHLFILLTLFATSHYALATEDNVDKLTQRLIELRGEVEDLSATLNLVRDEHKQHMASLVAQPLSRRFFVKP